MMNPLRKIIAVFRLIEDVKFLRRRIVLMSRDLADLKLIYCTEAEIEEAIRDNEERRAKTDGCDGWDKEIEVLVAELKRREMMRAERND